MPRLPLPPNDRPGVQAWVAEHLGDLARGGPGAVRGSGRFRGGQEAADTALDGYDVTGYARRRNAAWPQSARGASGLSPWIRHGLLPLPRVWDAVVGGPADDVGKFRDELLWQEYARHVYARVGRDLASDLRATQARPVEPWTAGEDPVWGPWWREMACMDAAVSELERDGWVVNQVRMWLASQWSVRGGEDWAQGERLLYAHLLDGSPAANRVGWQWTVGAGTGKPYGFSRWQVERRAPSLCRRCALSSACPVQEFPRTTGAERLRDPDPRLRADPDPAATAGPASVQETGEPEAVWLHGESMGSGDPALAAAPDLPVVFVFDEPLLARLRLSGARLVFLAETLAHLAQGRDLSVHRGRVPDELAGLPVTTTWTFAPGFRRHSTRVETVRLHPWPWLRRPIGGPVTSFSAWCRGAGGARPGRPRARGAGASRGGRPARRRAARGPRGRGAAGSGA